MTKLTFFSHRFFRLTGAFLLGLSLYLFFVVLFNKGLADYDLWGYLSFGRVFWEEGFFPYRDIFAYTPTNPIWIYHEWLTGVIFFGLQKYLGPASLQFLRYFLAVLTLYLVYITAVKKGGRKGIVFIVLIPVMILVSFGYVPVRAQIFTFFFFALTLYILEDARQTDNPGYLHWLPVMMIIWCNVHGGFVSGAGLIFLYGLGSLLNREKKAGAYFLWGLLSWSATLINPYGFDYWRYTVDAVWLDRSDITEWYSAFHALKTGVYVFPVSLFLVMSFLTVAVWMIGRRRDFTEILVMSAVLYLSFAHVRHNVLFGLVMGVYLPAWLTAIFGAIKSEWLRSVGKGLTIFFAGLSIVVYAHFYPVRPIHFVPTFKFFVSSDAYPIKALAWLNANHIRGNLLCHFDWGEYVMWCCRQDFRVAIDGRYETVYRQDVHREYFDFSSGRTTGEIFLKKYPHDVVLVKADSQTHQFMNRQKDWEAVYSDPTSVIFIRKKIENKF